MNLFECKDKNPNLFCSEVLENTKEVNKKLNAVVTFCDIEKQLEDLKDINKKGISAVMKEAREKGFLTK